MIPPTATETPTSSASTTSTAPTVETKLQKYVVGINTTMPLLFLNFKDEQGLATDFDIEILKAIADNQKFSLELIPSERDELFDKLKEGVYQSMMMPERDRKQADRIAVKNLRS